MAGKNLQKKAESYAEHRGLALKEPLGIGWDGNVWAMGSKQNAVERGQSLYLADWAIKLHHDAPQYRRERDCYERLASMDVSQVRSAHVPQFLKADDDWQLIEMTIVTRPFLLDFASAYLDFPPDFSAEIMEQWHATLEEIYEDRYPEVCLILRDMERMGIYLRDVHPGNLSFGDS